MEVGRRQLDLDPLLVVVLGTELLEQRAVIGQIQPKAREMALQRRLQFGRQARGKFLVIVIDEPVLVAEGKGIGDAHADVLVGADHLAGAGRDRFQTARQPAVQMLHGGDAGGDHLEGGIERVEVEIDPPRHQPGHKPQLERHVGRSELHRGQPDMVVGVDKPGQHDLTAGAEDRELRIFCDEFGGGPDLGDDAVTLQYRAVFDLLPVAAVCRLGEDGAGSDNAGGHGFSPGLHP